VEQAFSATDAVTELRLSAEQVTLGLRPTISRA